MSDEVYKFLDAIEQYDGKPPKEVLEAHGVTTDPHKKREIIRRLMGDRAASDYAKIKGIPER